MNTLDLLIICATLLALAVIVGAVVLVRAGLGADAEPLELELSAAEPVSDVVVGTPGAVVAIHTTDGDLRGTVVDYEPGVVCLERAGYLVDGQEQPMGGRVRVPLERVLWSQEV